MTSSEHSNAQGPDFITLARAPMPELIAAIEREVSDEGRREPPKRPGGAESIPAYAGQLADFVMAEAIRLIRLGTRVEVADAALAVSELLITPTGRALKMHHLEAYAVLDAASMALSTSVSPASKGGELTVMRSWNGNARKVVRHVSRAEDRWVRRAELRRLLDVDESYLSHLLADLEAAGLVERIREGRIVNVHLGPRGQAQHVQELLAVADERIGGLAQTAVQQAQALFDRLIAGTLSIEDTEIEGLLELRDQLREVQRDLYETDAAVEQVVTDGEHAVCHVRVSGRRGDETGSEQIERWLAWAARVAGERVVEVEPWSSRDSFPPAVGIGFSAHETQLDSLSVWHLGDPVALYGEPYLEQSLTDRSQSFTDELWSGLHRFVGLRRSSNRDDRVVYNILHGELVVGPTAGSSSAAARFEKSFAPPSELLTIQ